MRFLVFILLLSLSAAAADNAMRPGLLVRVWQSQDGLPGNVVRSVVQSSDGYLWVATAEGVARFDGFDFQLIAPGDEDLRRDRLAFSRLFPSAGGVVWAATYQGGLFRSDGGPLLRVLDDLQGPGNPLVTQLTDAEDGSVVFKRGGRLHRADASGRVTPVPPTPELEQAFAKDLASRASGGRVFDPTGILTLEDRLGRVWTTALDGGLDVTPPGQPAVPVSLPRVGTSFGINEMMEDREGNIWLASHVNGLVRVKQARVDVLELDDEQSERAVAALTQDRAGGWWIANRRSGITRWTPGESIYHEFTQRPAAALFEDRDSRFWFASRDGAVFCKGEDGFQPRFAKSQTPSKVRSISQDDGGTLWFGGSQGLASYDGTEVRQFGLAYGKAPFDVTVIQPFPGGGMIAGTTSGAVLTGGTSGFKTVATPETLNHQWVSGILPLSATETWVSTLGGGLWMWNGKSWAGFNAGDGLPDTRLTCVLDDASGHLWMGSLSGIIRVRRGDLLAHLRNPESPVQWFRLDHTDGLPSRECIGGFQPAGWRGGDGLLWFPTGNGVARVSPELVTPNSVPPPVYLQMVRTNGIVHPVSSGTVESEPGRARLEFHFVGLSFSAPEKTTYRARLAGLDDTWRELGTQRIASFEAVPPGKYTFEVMAVNGDGLRSTGPARISVFIKPQFWETAWFFISVSGFILSVAVAIGWTAARMRMKDRMLALKVRSAREGERSRIARDLHDDLGASLTEISILSALAAEDAGQSPLREPLDQLTIKAKHAVGNLDEIVWAVNPGQDTLRSLIDYTAAFAREFLDLGGITLRLDITREIPDHPLPATRRHGIFLSVREVINNIVKHSGAREVILHIAVANDVLDIHITDDGCGFDLEYAQAGNGLQNLKLRMRNIGGDCRIETRRAEGTTVFLTLPLYAS